MMGVHCKILSLLTSLDATSSRLDETAFQCTSWEFPREIVPVKTLHMSCQPLAWTAGELSASYGNQQPLL